MLSVTVALFVVATSAIVIRQWQLLRDAISGAVASGALRPLPPTVPTHADGDSVAKEPLKEMLDRVNALLSRSWTGFALTAALAMLLFFEISETQNGIFLNLAPDGLSADEAQAWAKEAYENWWASRSNLVGYFAYHLDVVVRPLTSLCFRTLLGFYPCTGYGACRMLQHLTLIGSISTGNSAGAPSVLHSRRCRFLLPFTELVGLSPAHRWHREFRVVNTAHSYVAGLP